MGDRELIAADSSSFQVETVSDYLATKGTTPSGWRVRGPLSTDEIVERATIEARHPLRHSRAAIARALAGADPSLRCRADVAAIIEELALDPDREVSGAAADTSRADPTGAPEGGPGLSPPLSALVEALGSIARQAAALRDVVARSAR
ncbi:MAG: hypothetical protein M5U31_15970 [Acidimicrobiia bacterium]|nr:hypothetical protein [Acidimicrobiia bacterium]